MFFSAENRCWWIPNARSEKKYCSLFDRYIIADDVEIADVSDKLTALGLTGPESRACSERAGIAVPELAHVSSLRTPTCDAREDACNALAFRRRGAASRGKSGLRPNT